MEYEETPAATSPFRGHPRLDCRPSPHPCVWAMDMGRVAPGRGGSIGTGDPPGRTPRHSPTPVQGPAAPPHRWRPTRSPAAVALHWWGRGGSKKNTRKIRQINKYNVIFAAHSRTVGNDFGQKKWNRSQGHGQLYTTAVWRYFSSMAFGSGGSDTGGLYLSQVEEGAGCLSLIHI